MKVLTKKQFQSRVQALAKARRIFIPHITTSLNQAFAFYQEILATEVRDILVSSVNGKRAKNILDDLKISREICQKCNQEMLFASIRTPQGKGNLYGYKAVWQCPHCGEEKFLKQSLEQIVRAQLEKLELEEERKWH